MLVAIFSLVVALLFGGGEIDYYMVSSLEKGMNKCIVDKGEKQEIKKHLKLSKSETKAFHKTRKQNIKELKVLFINRQTSTAQFNSFEQQQLNELSTYQNFAIETRINCLKHVTVEEWNCIIETAEKHTLKDKKKADKSIKEDPFKKVENVIEKEISSEINKKHLLLSLAKLENSYAQLLETLAERNEIDRETISQYGATADDLKSISMEINASRRLAFDNLVQFHHDVTALTDDSQWETIAKKLSKVVLG